ncbi:MAG: phosphatase PAP2 family protein [Eubacteriales bacterium]|nr:phosphatase PAP2 family protein [Eubacteriales bacterium]
MTKKAAWILALVLCLCFIGWTAAVAFVDVQAIGPEGSQVGLAAMNAWARKVTGVEAAEGGMRPFWYKLTNGLGYVSLIVALLFALLGLCQLVRRRGLARMDRELLMLGLFYVLLLGCYVLFEKVIVNYRPVMITAADGLEASYPSSHTMLACFIFATAMMQLPRLVKSSALRGLGKLVCAAIIAVAVVGRLLSGVHWLSDIIGGVLLSAALVALYAAATQSAYKPRHRKA